MTTVEYGLIIASVGIAALAGIFAMRNAFSSNFQSTVNQPGVVACTTATCNAINGLPVAALPTMTSTPAASVPSAPVITVTGGNKSLIVGWSPSRANGSTITDYEVQYKLTTAASWTTWNDGAGINSSTVITGLGDSEAYNVRVRANSNLGFSAYSTVRTATTLATPAPPAAPNVSAAGGDKSVTVSWSVPSPNGSTITGYEVEYKSGAGSWDPAGSTSVGVTTLIINSLSELTAYSVQVRATSDLGPGAWGNATATTFGVPATPALTATPGDTSVGLNWNAPASNGTPITGYDVEYKPSAESTWLSAGSPGTSTSIAVNSLVNGSAYDFRVRAKNLVGNGSWGSASATPLGACSASRNVALTGVNAASDVLVLTIANGDKVQTVTKTVNENANTGTVSPKDPASAYVSWAVSASNRTWTGQYTFTSSTCSGTGSGSLSLRN